LTRYLVTGGAGFIGSHLCDALVKRGDFVTVIDNFSTGNNQLPSEIEFFKGSIFDQDLMNNLISKSDHILHLAAAVGVFNIVNKPLDSLMTNIKGTELILELCDKYKKPILITSTSEVYGKNDYVPLSEDSDRVLGSPLLSRWSYSEAKAVDESMAYFYHQEKGLEVRIVRLFNTVGPRQVGHYGMVVPRFINAALKNKPLSVYGSGDQIRCFCHVTDAVRALLLIVDSDKSIGQVFNVGNNQQISIMDLAKKVIKVTNSNSEIEIISYEKAYPSGFEDMQRRVPNISKIKNVLGWQPEINLEQIIKDIAVSIKY
jgi:UDP-glucose 4-epimerase